MSPVDRRLSISWWGRSGCFTYRARCVTKSIWCGSSDLSPVKVVERTLPWMTGLVIYRRQIGRGGCSGGLIDRSSCLLMSHW